MLGGVAQQRFSYDFIRGSNQGQPGNDPYLQYLDAGTANPAVGGSMVRWSLLSYIGRVNYNFREKYFLTATLRRDGSSKFGANNKYGNFPSASVGWSLTKEGWFDNIKALHSLMLRASWEWWVISQVPVITTFLPLSTTIIMLMVIRLMQH
ncbi:TonB-dependent receptor [Chitinophaga pinensis]|uniref:Uncharacterized protein n=1 Tax=Chitinophaga pinensis TaxID=79329 RepID=A0A5C6LLX8_9BACT|nr:hypothetical protein FEF09_25125 [Chitinophaga pinensis]